MPRDQKRWSDNKNTIYNLHFKSDLTLQRKTRVQLKAHVRWKYYSLKFPHNFHRCLGSAAPARLQNHAGFGFLPGSSECGSEVSLVFTLFIETPLPVTASELLLLWSSLFSELFHLLDPWISIDPENLMKRDKVFTHFTLSCSIFLP